MEAVTGGANVRCLLQRWSWPAAFPESREEIIQAISSLVIRSDSEWGWLRDGREAVRRHGGIMVIR